MDIYYILYRIVQFQELRSSEPDRFCLNGLSQIGVEEKNLDYYFIEKYIIQ